MSFLTLMTLYTHTQTHTTQHTKLKPFKKNKGILRIKHGPQTTKKNTAKFQLTKHTLQISKIKNNAILMLNFPKGSVSSSLLFFFVFLFFFCFCCVFFGIF